MEWRNEGAPYTGEREARMTPASYSTLVENMQSASIPIRELRGAGCVAVTPAAGRVVAMAFSPDQPNLLWSNPEFDRKTKSNAGFESLVGGLGGDRLWFGPEVSYHWQGKPDWKEFKNYQVPKASDPGNYRFEKTSASSLELQGEGVLHPRDGRAPLGFSICRNIRLTPPPISSDDLSLLGIDFVGIEMSHTLEIDDSTSTGRIDLWHLLQVPVGSTLIVPLNRYSEESAKEPLAYGLPGRWVKRSDHVAWKFTGLPNAKFGLAAAALTGRTAVVRRLKAEDWCLIVREFTVSPQAEYGDHPFGRERSNHAFQAWDGFGFGEMEYHSVVLDIDRSQRKLSESDRLWVFGGRGPAIAGIASKLLGLNLSSTMKPKRHIKIL